MLVCGLWSRFLNFVLTEEEVDVSVITLLYYFSKRKTYLETIGIVRLGESIGNIQTRLYYPKSFKDHTNEILKRNITDISNENIEFNNSIIPLIVSCLFFKQRTFF